MATTDAIDQLRQSLKSRESSYHVLLGPLADHSFEIALFDQIDIEHGAVGDLSHERPYGHEIHFEHEVTIVRCFAALFCWRFVDRGPPALGLSAA